MEEICAVVQDLLPLYIEDMLSEESKRFVKQHLGQCTSCLQKAEEFQKELPPQTVEIEDTEVLRPLQKIKKRRTRQLQTLTYTLILFFLLFGFSRTQGTDIMVNSLLMPLVGVLGYIVFDWRSVYQMPILVTGVQLIAVWLELIPISMEWTEVLQWSAIFCFFVYLGITIAFLLQYAFRKES